MKRAISLALLGSIALLAMALAGASSAAGQQAGPAGAQKAASSTVRAIGPGFVRQVGLRNYAGPNCPGSGWNCTSSTRVLQAASPGGQNVAECSGPGATLVGESCTITQSGGENTARCTLKNSSVAPAPAQACTITQTGASNLAFVTQTVSQSAGATQYATQTASVTQTGSVSNQLQLIQDASQNIKTGSEQLQNLYQSAVVTQMSTVAVNNTSSIYQSQLQKEYAKSTAQSQNDGSVAGLGDCFSGPPTKPNVCANVTQVSVGGKNDNHLKQFVSQDENSSGPATQVQGEDDGGLDGRVHQETSGSGSSLNEVNQNKALKQTVPKGGISSQTQIDPVRCCGTFSQLGGTGNSETISQSSSLSASDPGASQESTLIGESNTPVGSCSITQKASVNKDSATNTYSQPTSCPTVTLVTECTPGSEGDCSASEPVVGEPDSFLEVGVRNVTNADPGYSATTDADPGDVIVYRVVYSNDGTGAAHNVLLSLADTPPAFTSYTNALLFDAVTAGLFCPLTVTLGGTCQLGQASEPGTVTPGMDPQFTTMYFAVAISNLACNDISYTATGSTTEEGAITSASPATLNLFDCPA